MVDMKMEPAHSQDLFYQDDRYVIVFLSKESSCLLLDPLHFQSFTFSPSNRKALVINLRNSIPFKQADPEKKKKTKQDEEEHCALKLMNFPYRINP